MRKNGTQAVERTLNLFTSIVADQGKSSIADLGRRMDLPAASTYRLVSALVRNDFLIPVGRGRHVPGARLASLASMISINLALVAVGRPIIGRLARRTGCVAHLGILEQDMVTYLLKAGRESSGIFTEEGKQLEAYCSGIGKILLASLPPDELAAYLDGGPFISLTSQTITEPGALANEFALVAKQGFATDVEEIANGLFCLAVGINDLKGNAIAAISVSSERMHRDAPQVIEMLRKAAREIEDAIYVRAINSEVSVVRTFSTDGCVN